MTFWDHLDELRGVIIKILIAIVVLMIISFLFKEEVFSIVLAPKESGFVLYQLLQRAAEGMGIESFHLENFLCRPDFIAYDFPTRKVLSNRICRRLWGLESVTWTLRTPEDHETALKEGWIPIFENYLP